MSSTANATFSVSKVLKTLLGLLAFAVMAGFGIRRIPTNPREGWFAAILFGIMCVVAVIEIVRICGLDQDQSPAVATRVRIRRTLIYTGSIIVTLFLGIADHFISESFTNSFPRPGVWLGTFLTNLAFYPLREQKEDLPNFTIWTIYCALTGVLSVAISYLMDWVDRLL